MKPKSLDKKRRVLFSEVPYESLRRAYAEHSAAIRDRSQSSSK